ncbi:hypothetical protein [Neolewinella antarctica]|uniref:Polysaccharide chain length determinant N-terminal domain-containing protein n=1 Tax=Neolewinella antarctica TaxID=442734 RepID=A0ABX0XB91_9BACT|nr:hypothetical protein [Neolewinella antarctica]NJC26103.1 hypothetical protein [Neolewinella antarctica]
MSEVKEVSIHEIFVLIGSYVALIRRYWYWIIIVSLGFAAFFAYRATEVRATYQAPLTFVVNEDSPSSGGVGNILGQFGLGGGTGGQLNLTKILALAESQKIMNSLLLDSLVIDDQIDKIGNHIIREYDLVEVWEMEDIIRISGDSLENLNREEKRLLKKLYRFVLDDNNGLLKFTADEMTGILDVTASTINEELSLALSEDLYRRLSDFYTIESTGNALASVNGLQYKADSIKTALESADYSLATLLDRSQGVVQRSNLVRQAQLNREVQILGIAYGEVLRNLEQASFVLSTKTPFFQIVDEPFMPLSIKGESWIQEAIKGFILGLFLIFGCLAARKFYQDVMNDPLNNTPSRT